MQSLVDVQPARPSDRAWIAERVRRLQADARRSADTHLVRVPLPAGWDVDLYLKDESTHRTGSLKHRLARSLFLHALCNGWIGPGTPAVEASSGSTAVSEAWVARRLDVPFVAVMARTTSPEKIALIEREGGRCHLVEDPASVYAEAARLAAEVDGHYLDQFTFAERATDWRGTNNIAESIYEQMQDERHPVPEWVVVGAGTGGTSATLGRFARYRQLATRVCVVDPENSAFLMAFAGEPTDAACGSRIEGIGRPRVEPSFVPTVVERMLGVPDAASVAAMRFLRDRTGLRAGGSTGTNLYGALFLACEMSAAGHAGSIVTLLCDHAERYCATYDSDEWLASAGMDLAPYTDVLATAWDTGVWTG